MSPRVDPQTGEVLPSLIDTLADAEDLLARRAVIVQQVAPMRALFGGNGYFGERVFKLDEAKIDTAIRTAVRRDLKAGEKMPTEGAIDAMVRQQSDYVAALMAQIDRKATWIKLEEELNEIEWRLKIRTSDSYLLGAEAKLQ